MAIRRYREGGGGLGFARGRKSRVPAPEVRIESVGAESVARRKPVDDMTLRELSSELADIQAMKDQGQYVPKHLWDRFMALKRIYNAMVRL